MNNRPTIIHFRRLVKIRSSEWAGLIPTPHASHSRMDRLDCVHIRHCRAPDAFMRRRQRPAPARPDREPLDRPAAELVAHLLNRLTRTPATQGVRSHSRVATLIEVFNGPFQFNVRAIRENGLKLSRQWPGAGRVGGVDRSRSDGERVRSRGANGGESLRKTAGRGGPPMRTRARSK